MIEKVNSDIVKTEVREKIIYFERLLKEMPNSFEGDSEVCPLEHDFADDIYVRKIFIPEGTVLTGKIHKHSHPNVLLVGEVEVFTESEGLQTLKAPLSMISAAGTKRVVYAKTDVVWITYHNVGKERDLKKIEEMIIAESYEMLDKKLLV